MNALLCQPFHVPPIAAGVDFLEEPLAIFGLLLMLGAVVSGIARRSFLSLTAAFVVAGFLLGKDSLGLLDLDPTSDFVQGLAVVALILILFRDGLEVEREMLQKAWHCRCATRTGDAAHLCLVALVTRLVTDLSWADRSWSTRCCRQPTRCSRPPSSRTRACRG